MRYAVAGLNLLLGVVYLSYGIMTIIDLRRGWAERGFSHFGLAWIAMAFTCGPHHFEHGMHILLDGRNGGALDLVAVVVGLPAGVTWFLLRVEALMGGRGDRFISGTPRWISLLPAVSVTYVVLLFLASVVVLTGGADFGPRMVPNVLLMAVYFLVGYYLLRTQLRNRGVIGGWSVSGLSLTFVFPTCGLMHIAFVLYAAAGTYNVDTHGLVIDWLAVPAALYFVWVVRSTIYLRTFEDWNRSSAGSIPEPEPEPEAVPV
jgi:hypothetical protein